MQEKHIERKRTYCNEFDEDTATAVMDGSLGVRIQEICGMHEDDWSSALLRTKRMLSASREPNQPWEEVLKKIKEDLALSLVLSNIARFAIDEIAPQFRTLTEKVFNCLGEDKEKALCHLQSNPNHYVIVSVHKGSEEAKTQGIHGQFKIMNGENEHIAWYRDKYDYSNGPGFGFPHDYFLLTQFPDLEIQPFVNYLVETQDYHRFGKDEGSPYPKEEYFRWMLEHLPLVHKEKLVDALLTWMIDQKTHVEELFNHSRGGAEVSYEDFIGLDSWVSLVRSLHNESSMSEYISTKFFLPLRECYADICISHLESFKIRRMDDSLGKRDSSRRELYFVQGVLDLMAFLQPVESKDIDPNPKFWEEKLDSLSYFAPEYAFFLFDLCIAGALSTFEPEKREEELPRLLGKTHDAYRRITDNLSLPHKANENLYATTRVLGWEVTEFDATGMALRNLKHMEELDNGEVKMTVRNFVPHNVSEYAVTIAKDMLDSAQGLPWFPLRSFKCIENTKAFRKERDQEAGPITLELK